MEEWLSSYKEKGWVVLPNFFTEAEIKSIHTEALNIAKSGVNISGWRGLACASYFSEKLFKFYTSKKLYDLTRQVLGDEVYLFNDELIYRTRDYYFSFDAHYDNWFYLQNRNNSVHFMNCYVFFNNVSPEDQGIYVLDLEKYEGNPADSINKDGFVKLKESDDYKIKITQNRGDVFLIRGDIWQGSYNNMYEKNTLLYACSFTETPITEKIHYIYNPAGIPEYFYTQKFDTHSGDIC